MMIGRSGHTDDATAFTTRPPMPARAKKKTRPGNVTGSIFGNETVQTIISRLDALDYYNMNVVIKELEYGGMCYFYYFNHVAYP